MPGSAVLTRLRSHLRALTYSLDLVSVPAVLCTGVLVAIAAMANPWYPVFAVPLVLPLQRSWRHRELVRSARNDAKTGLLNAAAWQQAANAEASRAARTGRPVAAAMLDIDHFKKVNDKYGHLAGDRVLAAIAAKRAGQNRVRRADPLLADEADSPQIREWARETASR